jgi:two-component system response regulator YesN
MRIRLAVIDDEVLVRKGIVSSIDWNHYDIDIVGEATDGISGMELIRATKPHIVLTDIRMPHMDGLELTRMIHKELPETKILILSVLEDFQTVREALRLGVVDYVQKLLMTPDELLNAVIRIKDNMRIEASMPHTDLSDEQRINLSGNELWEWLQGSSSVSIERLINGHTSFVVGHIYVNNKNRSLRHSNVIQESDEYREVNTWFMDSTHSLIKNALMDIESDRLFWFLIMCEEDSIPLHLLDNELELLLSNCIYKDITISIGLSQSFCDIEKRQTARKQAQHSLHQRFFRGDGCIHVYTEGECQAGSDTTDFVDHALHQGRRGVSRWYAFEPFPLRTS